MCILSGPELLSTLPLQGRFYSSAFNAPCKLAFACSLWHSKLATAEEVLILVPDCSNSITFCGSLCFPSTTHCLTHVTRACNALVTQTKQLCQPGKFCRLPLEFLRFWWSLEDSWDSCCDSQLRIIVRCSRSLLSCWLADRLHEAFVEWQCWDLNPYSTLEALLGGLSRYTARRGERVVTVRHKGQGFAYGPMGIAETKPARTAVNPRSYEGVLPMRGKEANQQTMSGNPNVQEKQTWIPLKLISGASKLQKRIDKQH